MENDDSIHITDFGIRALYLFAKFVLPRLNDNDRQIIQVHTGCIVNDRCGCGGCDGGNAAASNGNIENAAKPAQTPPPHSHVQIINKVIKIISTTTLDFETIIINNTELFTIAYKILHPQIDLPPTLTNYAGIVLGKMEDILIIN